MHAKRVESDATSEGVPVERSAGDHPGVGPDAILNGEPVALASYRESLYWYGGEPEIEYVHPNEYARRRRRHLEDGVPMNVPSRLAWP